MTLILSEKNLSEGQKEYLQKRQLGDSLKIVLPYGLRGEIAKMEETLNDSKKT